MDLAQRCLGSVSSTGSIEALADAPAVTLANSH